MFKLKLFSDFLSLLCNNPFPLGIFAHLFELFDILLVTVLCFFRSILANFRRYLLSSVFVIGHLNSGVLLELESAACGLIHFLRSQLHSGFFDDLLCLFPEFSLLDLILQLSYKLHLFFLLFFWQQKSTLYAVRFRSLRASIALSIIIYESDLEMATFFDIFFNVL